MPIEEPPIPPWPETPEARKSWLPVLRERLSASPYYAKLIEERGDEFLEEWIDNPWPYSYPLAKRAPPGTIIPPPLTEEMKAEYERIRKNQKSWPVTTREEANRRVKEILAAFDSTEDEPRKSSGPARPGQTSEDS